MCRLGFPRRLSLATVTLVIVSLISDQPTIATPPTACQCAACASATSGEVTTLWHYWPRMGVGRPSDQLGSG
jgi:hypothetical protein